VSVAAAKRHLASITIAVGVVCAAVTFLFDTTFTLTVGIVLMLSFIVLGAFTVATPEYLGEDEPEDG
jgi:Ca2+/Na+ antiporter